MLTNLGMIEDLHVDTKYNFLIVHEGDSITSLLDNVDVSHGIIEFPGTGDRETVEDHTERVWGFVPHKKHSRGKKNRKKSKKSGLRKIHLVKKDEGAYLDGFHLFSYNHTPEFVLKHHDKFPAIVISVIVPAKTTVQRGSMTFENGYYSAWKDEYCMVVSPVIEIEKVSLARLLNIQKYLKKITVDKDLTESSVRGGYV